MNTNSNTGRKEFWKNTLMLPLVAAMTAGLACGAIDSGPNRPNDPQEFILEDARAIITVNAKPYLENEELPGILLEEDEDTIDFQEAWKENWERDNPDIPVEDLRKLTIVVPDGEYSRYFVASGEFDFSKIRNELEDQGYEENT